MRQQATVSGRMPAQREIDMLTRRTLNLVTILLFAQSTPTLAADLSPATWPTAQRTAAENLEAVTTSPPVAHVVEGRAGIVSATLSPIMIHASDQGRRFMNIVAGCSRQALIA